jgi:hypothetical protein
MKEIKRAHEIGKSEGKQPFGRPRHRQKDNSKMDFKKLSLRTRTGSAASVYEHGIEFSVSIKSGNLSR